MKRFIFVVVFSFICFCLSAQKRGDMFLSGSVGFSMDKAHNYISSDGAYTVVERKPFTFLVSAGIGYSYFVMDNFRIGLNLEVPFSSSYGVQYNDSYLRKNYFGLYINPELAYHFRLLERLFYTPELGFSYCFGSYKEDVTPDSFYKLPFSGWEVYLNLLSFEYRISRHFSVGVSAGSLSYFDFRLKEKSSYVYFGGGEFSFKLNEASIRCAYYF